jgi:hypothetical protein
LPRYALGPSGHPYGDGLHAARQELKKDKKQKTESKKKVSNGNQDVTTFKENYATRRMFRSTLQAQAEHHDCWIIAGIKVVQELRNQHSIPQRRHTGSEAQLS